ncbi:MAG: hypothetical protein R8G60_11735 [Roseovarius pacificus]|nr:hypothetical protein [Roseovarius pacificus]
MKQDDMQSPNQTEIDLSILEKAARDAGVYVFFKNGRAIYVGQSVDLRRRLLEHCNRYGTCDLYIIPCKREDLLNVEAMMIHSLKPTNNTQCMKHFRHQRIDMRKMPDHWGFLLADVLWPK